MTDTTQKFVFNTSERFFEKLMFGQGYLEAPIISSRICGANSIANNITATRAIESACGITSSVQTEKMRDLLLYAQIIQSHTMHLYLDVLPDFTGVSSLSELQKDHEDIFKNAVDLKHFADSIIELIGGRTIHPISNIPGGFTSHPTTKKLKEILDCQQNIVHCAQNTLSVFAGFDYPSLELENTFSAVHKPGEYVLSGSGIWTSDEKHFVVEKYKEYILEELRHHSPVKYGIMNNKETMVGPLARLTLNKIDDKDLKNLIETLGINLDSNNPFDNIIASAIELYYFTKKAMNSIQNLLDKSISIEPIKLPTKFGIGTACCESPDGTLIHSYRLNNKGNIVSCDIITPSVFNLPSFESSLKVLDNVIKDSNQAEKNKITKLLFKSYRLCGNCGSH